MRSCLSEAISNNIIQVWELSPNLMETTVEITIEKKGGPFVIEAHFATQGFAGQARRRVHQDHAVILSGRSVRRELMPRTSGWSCRQG